MPLTRPVVGSDISAADFGQPVYDLVAQPNWTGVTFASSDWINYGGFAPCVYRKVGTTVQMRGVAQRKNSQLSAGWGSDMISLPAGYRPLATLLLVSLVGFSNVGTGRLDIQSSGIIKVTPAVDIPIDGYVGFTFAFWTD